MDDETFFLKAAGLILLPAIAWAIRMSWMTKSTNSKVSRLLNMHEDPDKYGFGTVETNKVIEANTAVMNKLSHYVEWEIENRTGKKAPPPH